MSSKDVAVVNWKTGEDIHCSRSHAARIIGVTYQTIRRWAKARKYENYNHFTVLFRVKSIRQFKGFAKRKADINKENFKRFHRV